MFLAGSEGRELAPELLPHNAAAPDDNLLLRNQPQEIGTNEWYIYKPRWGAFYKSCLEETLRAQGISTIVLAGCNYPNCIRATVYEASERDFRVVAITDGISNFSENGWNELSSIGINLMSAEEFISELNGN
jgi:nicotinamidase-related amidase